MAASQSIDSALQPTEPGSRRVRVLIADDNSADRLLLQTMLTRQGHSVVMAADGEQAVSQFVAEQPEIVLLDALMPNMDGFEAASRIKEVAGEAFVPIIFLTSLQEADSLARCLDVGGDDFVSKPYNDIILKAKINAFARMVEMHRTARRQRDQIIAHNNRLLHEQEVAKRVFDKVAHAGCLDAPNIQYALSPIAVFNGDVALAGAGPSGNLLVLLGDFTGHGLNAAIGAMPMAQSFYTMLEKGFSMKDILREINLKLHNVLPVGVFCCALIVEFDFKSQEVQVWNGGLPDGVIYRPGTGEVVRLPSRHLPLGICNNTEFDDRVQALEVQPDDRLYIWSDGIIEAQNDAAQMYGEDRLFQVIADNRDPQKLFHEINVSVNSFIGENVLGDDISIIEVTVVRAEDFQVTLPEYIGSRDAGPRDWSLKYELRPETLKAFDPLPLMLHVLMQVPYLRAFGWQIYTALSELYSNALDHGLLELDSSLKDSPQGFSHYYQLRDERLARLSEGVIAIELDYTGDRQGGRLQIDIEDSGYGFDYPRWLREREQAADSEDYAGRGIQLLRSLCHSVTYSTDGNRATAVFLWGERVDA